MCGGAQALNQTLGPHFFPERGLVQMPPTDPLIYRLYESAFIFWEGGEGAPVHTLLRVGAVRNER